MFEYSLDYGSAVLFFGVTIPYFRLHLRSETVSTRTIYGAQSKGPAGHGLSIVDQQQYLRARKVSDLSSSGKAQLGFSQIPLGLRCSIH